MDGPLTELFEHNVPGHGESHAPPHATDHAAPPSPEVHSGADEGDFTLAEVGLFVKQYIRDALPIQTLPIPAF